MIIMVSDIQLIVCSWPDGSDSTTVIVNTRIEVVNYTKNKNHFGILKDLTLKLAAFPQRILLTYYRSIYLYIIAQLHSGRWGILLNLFLLRKNMGSTSRYPYLERTKLFNKIHNYIVSSFDHNMILYISTQSSNKSLGIFDKIPKSIQKCLALYKSVPQPPVQNRNNLANLRTQISNHHTSHLGIEFW